jgi:hypothetical protein
MSLDHNAFQRWLDAYVAAWRTYDPDAIRALFASDVRYAFSPFDEEPINGRDALVRSWLEAPDPPDLWEAEYRPLAIDGDVYVAHGRTRYFNDERTGVDREFANVFVLRFDDADRCIEFTEWYMRRRPEPDPDEPPPAG